MSCQITSGQTLPPVNQPYLLLVELSSPTATVAPNRAPDSNGWYNHPVSGAPTANSFSGIASCTRRPTPVRLPRTRP